MSWRDQLQPGSWRGVAFSTTSQGEQLGRRVVTHQYPQRDAPFNEDLGRLRREWSLSAFVIGPDYMVDRDRLRAAVEQSGPGRLVLPWLGEVQAVITKARLRESTEEGGLARFDLTFVEAGTALPEGGQEDSSEEAIQALAEVQALQSNSAGALLSYSASPNQAASAQALMALDVAAAFGLAVAEADAIAALIRTPYALSSELITRSKALFANITEPLRAMQIYRDLLRRRSRSTELSEAGQAGAAEMMWSFDVALTWGGLSAAVEVAIGQTWQHQGQVIEGLEILLEGFARLAEAESPEGRTLDDDTLEALASLRQGVIRDLRGRVAQLPVLQAVTLTACQPAIVLAWQLYGDVSRDAELVERLAVPHPGFLPAGVPLEVLSV